jgi:hypothetical protein
MKSEVFNYEYVIIGPAVKISLCFGSERCVVLKGERIDAAQRYWK